MDRVLPGESLPRTLSVPDKRVTPNIIIDSSDPGVVRDVWSGEFCEMTSATAHRGSAEPASERTPDTNCDHPWEQMKENVRRFDMKRSTDSWTKVGDLRHTFIQYLLQQNRFGTGEAETIENEEDVRRHAGGMPLLTDLSLAMRTDPLALVRGTTEFVTVILGHAVTFVFPDVKVEAYRRSVLHENLISAVDGSAIIWCEQVVLRELMKEDSLFAKISETEMTAINFDDQLRNGMGEVDRGHIEAFPKLWNLRPYNKTNGEITRTPNLMASYHKAREETKGWGEYKQLPEETPELP